MDIASVEATSLVPGTPSSAEDAWELARRLVRLLDSLATDAPGSEHHGFRLTSALAATVADELEGIVQRRVQGQEETRTRPDAADGWHRGARASTARLL